MTERDDMGRADLLKENERLRHVLQTLVSEADLETPSGKTPGYVYAKYWKWARKELAK